MDFELNEQQKMYQEAIRGFSVAEMLPLVEQAERSEVFPVQLFNKLGDLGYLCVSYPAEYGAAGLGLTEHCITCEELGAVSHGIGGSIAVQSGVATSAIKDHGSEALRRDYLRPAIRGSKIAAFGLTEPNAGSDVAGMQTTAAKRGDSYVINGSKTFITNGGICDFLTLAAYTDKSKGHRGISLFAVDKNAKGLTRSKLHKFCLRSGDMAEFAFNDCEVPRENLIGEEGRGFYYLMESLDSGRVGHAAIRVGTCRAVFEATLEYAKQRVQFARPIATFQANSMKLARMALDIDAARLMTYRAAWLSDLGRPYTKEASMAKLLASEVYQRVATEAMQLHGGAAVLEESAINRHYRDSYAGRVTEGTSEIQALIIARQLGIDAR